MKYRTYLVIEDKIVETYGYYYEQETAEKLAIKLSRQYTGPKAKATVWGITEDELIPQEIVLATWQMGRRIKN